MPPASLSTFAVMNPGPTTARTMATRTRQLLRKVIARSAAVTQHRDHIISGDDAGEPCVLVDYRKRDQIVFVEERGHFVLGRVGGAGNVGFAQFRELHGRRG